MSSDFSGVLGLPKYVAIGAMQAAGTLLLMLNIAQADNDFAPATRIADSGSVAALAPGLLDGFNARVGVITIDNQDVFDLDDPREDNWLYQLANKAHVRTRRSEIEQQLLFETGDRFSSRDLDESERVLRANRYLQDAEITPVRFDGDVVDILVHTTDTWTLMPKLDFSRSGGQNSAAFGFKELNLLGTGMEVEVAHESDVDRSSNSMMIVDKNLGRSWYGIDAYYADSSDGYDRHLSVGKPFFSLGTTRAGSISYFDTDRVDSIYDRGELHSEYRHHGTSYEVFGGRSKGLTAAWTRRYTAGMAYDRHDFTPVTDNISRVSIAPDDRKFVYPFIGVEVLEDKYETGENFDEIRRTEDRYLGSRIGVRLGYADRSFGSDRSAWLVNGGAQTAFGTTEQTLFVSGNVGLRLENDGLQNFLLSFGARYYKRQSPARLLYASLAAAHGENLDIDSYRHLGGDNGLRGYPLRYLHGDGSVLLTLEERIFTDWYPFRLFRIGGAVFFDAGRTWGANPAGTENPGFQKDIGLGLRIGNSRSGLGDMIHVDLAFPLDGDESIRSVQLLIGTKKGF